MKNIVVIIVFLVSISIIFLGLYSLSTIHFNLPNKHAAKSKTNSSLEEVDIMSERFMFSPMMVRLKKGRPVKLILTTYDVPHGIFEPDLKINLSASAGQPAETVIIPDKIGEFTVSCSLYCGADHDKMKMTFIVDE